MKYYGTSHASLNDTTCPWVAKYRLEDSNINSGVHYCTMKAYVKICTAKNPEEIPFRGPEFISRSKHFNPEDVDCSHVAPAPKQPKFCRVMSAVQARGQQRFLLPAGLTFQEVQSSVSIPSPYVSNTNDDQVPIDPSPSVSEVGSNNTNTISMGLDDIARMMGMVGSAVADALKASCTAKITLLIEIMPKLFKNFKIQY